MKFFCKCGSGNLQRQGEVRTWHNHINLYLGNNEPVVCQECGLKHKDYEFIIQSEEYPGERHKNSLQINSSSGKYWGRP